MLKENPGPHSGKALGNLMAIFGFVIIGFYLFSYISNHNYTNLTGNTAATKGVNSSISEPSSKVYDVSPTTTNELETKKAITITIEQLLKDYFDNPAEADKKHKNKLYCINGKVSMIGSNAWTNDPFLIFASNIDFKTSNIRVTGWFTPDDRKVLEPLEYGDEISIIGKCQGLNSGTNSIDISDLKILNTKKSK